MDKIKENTKVTDMFMEHNRKLRLPQTSHLNTHFANIYSMVALKDSTSKHILV
jgi:hypothetical protein